jgi:hypothetical protein
MAVGVDQSVRGRGLTRDGYIYLRKVLDAEGVKKAVFVTSYERLAGHFKENQDAESIDHMLWYSLCR